ncbi:MAG: hypothetical protein ABH887_02400 [bacterium]
MSKYDLIWKCILDGKSNGEIATLLGVSYGYITIVRDDVTHGGGTTERRRYRQKIYRQTNTD